jgi:hypothetical protein
MKKHLIALSLAALALPAVAADYTPHSYTYIEGSWFDRSAEWDIETGESDDKLEADGWAFGGSYLTQAGLLIQARYSEGDIDQAWGITESEAENLLGASVNFEVKSYGFLIGGANQVNAKLSTWGGFGFDRDELELSASGYSGSIGYDVDMYSLGGGARYTVIPMIELSLSGRIIHFRADETELLDDYKDTDGEVTAGVRFQPLAMLSVGASYSRQLDAESEYVKADVRFQF